MDAEFLRLAREAAAALQGPSWVEIAQLVVHAVAVVVINPKLAKFYGRTQWTQIDWEQRQALRRKTLALWLHGFYASHAAPHPLNQCQG